MLESDQKLWVYKNATFLVDPGPTATTVACSTLAWDFSGIMMPPFVTSSAASRSTSTRSNMGRNFRKACFGAKACLVQWSMHVLQHYKNVPLEDIAGYKKKIYIYIPLQFLPCSKNINHSKANMVTITFKSRSLSNDFLKCTTASAWLQLTCLNLWFTSHRLLN